MADSGKPCQHTEIKKGCPACTFQELDEQMAELTVQEKQAADKVDKMYKLSNERGSSSDKEYHRTLKDYDQWQDIQEEAEKKKLSVAKKLVEARAERDELVEESKTSADVWDRKVTLYNAERSRQRFYMIPLNDDLRTTVEGKTTKSTAPEKRIDRTKVRANLDYLLRTPVATQLALKMGSDDPGSEAPFFDPTKALAGRPEPASLAVGSTWQSKHYGVPSFVERAPQLLKMVEEDGSIALGDLRRYHCETYDQDKNSTAEEQYALLKRYKEYNALLMDMFNARAHESTGPWGAAEKPTTEAQGKWDDVSQTLPEDLRRQEKAPAEEVEYLECTFATFFEWVKKEEKKVGGTLAFKEKLQGIREKREEVYLKLHGMAEEIKKRPASSDKIPEGCNRPETYLSGYTTPLFKGDYETSER